MSGGFDLSHRTKASIYLNEVGAVSGFAGGSICKSGSFSFASKFN